MKPRNRKTVIDEATVDVIRNDESTLTHEFADRLFDFVQNDMNEHNTLPRVVLVAVDVFLDSWIKVMENARVEPRNE